MSTAWAIVLVVACGACGERDRDRAAVDGGPGTDGGGLACGAELCAVGEVCCTACDGTKSCGMACAGIACTDAGARACRTQSDCMAGTEWCRAPGEAFGCGIPCMVTRDCEAHTDCADGGRCAEYAGPCCLRGDPASSRCVAPCTATSCGEGERCNADGLCEPVPCTEGWTCPSQTSCAGMGDAHGCLRATCMADADCGSGYCVRGSCYEMLGECTPPAA